MTVFPLLIFIAGFIMIARSALFWLYWIQTKDNRLDRVWLAIQQREFWRLIISTHRTIAVVLLIIWFLLFNYWGSVEFEISDRQVLGGALFIPLYIFAYSIHTLHKWRIGALKLPRWTLKVAVLLFVVVILEILIAVIPFYLAFSAGAIDKVSSWLMAIFFFGAYTIAFEILQPLIVLAIFTLAYTPNIFLHRYFIIRAKKKIATHKNLIVIGITGSYGKTSTKEFLAHILNKKHKVLKTPAHINVDTGVAKVILSALKPEHEIFIVEMGAYNRGEIKKICDLVRPQYAVLTGLSDQHLELFGSMSAIADAKFELIESVGQSNKIFANEDSAELVSEFKRRAIMPTWYGLRGHASRFKVSDLRLNEDGTEFTLHGVQFSVPTIGTAALNNLLGAITVAVELNGAVVEYAFATKFSEFERGEAKIIRPIRSIWRVIFAKPQPNSGNCSRNDIRQQPHNMHLDDLPAMLQDLPILSATMQPQAGPNGALLIDDTYNANTEGVVTALADLAHFKRARKIFVFSEVIELGARTDEDHAKIAQAAAKSATHAFLLPSRVLHVVRSQLIERGYEAAQIIRSTEELRKLLNADTVVLFEGRDAAKVLAKIIRQ